MTFPFSTKTIFRHTRNKSFLFLPVKIYKILEPFYVKLPSQKMPIMIYEKLPTKLIFRKIFLFYYNNVNIL